MIDPKKPTIITRVVSTVMGLGFVVAFTFVRLTPIKTLLLFLASAFLLGPLALLVSSRLPALPEGHAKKFAVAISIELAALFQLISGGSTAWGMLAWLGLIYGILAMVSTGKHILFDFAILRHLLRTFEKAGVVDLPFPLIYLAGEPGWGAYFANRLVTKIMQSLWRYHYQPGGSMTLSREPMAFIRQRRIDT